MQTLQHFYFSLSIKTRIGLLCFCYSLCILATTILGRSASATISYCTMGLFILLGAFFGWINIWGIGSSIRRVLATLQTMAQGDLSQEIAVRNKNEISAVLISIREVQTSMRSIISGMQATSSDLTAAAGTLKQTSERMAAGAEQAVGQTGSAVQAVEELSSVSSDISRNCQLMADKASETRQATSAGERTIADMSHLMGEIGRLVSDTTLAVQSLGNNSSEIGEIVGTIEDIADQTNLLALNAAIEAARAGEQGRGFAVVADEVRSLAERTTQATREIQKIIGTLQGDVKNVIGSMEQSAASVENGARGVQLSNQAISEIKSHIEVLTDSVAQVATAIEQQTATTAGVMNNIHAITAIIEDVSRGTHQTDTAAANLSGSAGELMSTTRRFRV
ncbi:methyl-accepting chemotaxis protein [Geobacter sp. SVR]|uniref:methyl-accepting chemotaxis protein n=1 Tax=Geobacter sp. SVR TaxID=2495594 RepID=UPI00143EF88F|nr:methyl-accepting chemotaxis protein [Geobacter sp. SVR]BCS56030.1 methyl-accepting chemotaxis protein [Geobacter sp. SVR]GCF84793.1 methyl-accepting chemotaxis protein [Geobacter sp. SVR]